MNSYGVMLLSVLSLFLLSCNDMPELKPKGAFLGLEPTDSPQLLPDFINSSMIEFNGTFSPDGTEFYYTTDIPGQGMIVYKIMLPDSSWSESSIAAFSGTFSDYDPLFSPDGNRLYFSSRRPVPGDTSEQSNIWFIERQDSGWTKPVHVDLNGLSAYYSSLTSKGDIYFNAAGQLHKATRQDTGEYSVESLGEMLDSVNNEVDPFIAPDESYLIFRGYGDRSYGRADLFISFKLNGHWAPAENLGQEINSKAQEVCPYVTTDGRFFIFSSDKLNQDYPTESLIPLDQFHSKYQTWDNGLQNIYYMSADFIEKFREKHLVKFSK